MDLPFTRAEVVTLRPGDVVVFRAAARLSVDAQQKAGAVLDEMFPGHEALILQPGEDISVIRPQPGLLPRMVRRLRFWA